MRNSFSIGKVVIGAIVIFLFYLNCGSISGLPDNPSVEDISSYLYAQAIADVRPYLKDSATASFAYSSSWKYAKLEDNVYSVKASVKAENGFGGKVQTPIYAVYLFIEPVDTLTLQALRLGDTWVRDGYYAPFGEERPR